MGNKLFQFTAKPKAPRIPDALACWQQGDGDDVATAGAAGRLPALGRQVRRPHVGQRTLRHQLARLVVPAVAQITCMLQRF